MHDDDIWRYGQYSRRLHDYILDLSVAWNDNAAREVSLRYLQPQAEDAQDLDRHLAELKQTLAKAQTQIAHIRNQAPEAAHLAEQIAGHAHELRAEEKTAYQHTDMSAQSRAHAAELFRLVQQCIEDANASCVNVGGGSAGEEIVRVTATAESINAKSAIASMDVPVQTSVGNVSGTPARAHSGVYHESEQVRMEAKQEVALTTFAASEMQVFSGKSLESNKVYFDNGYSFTANSQGQVARIQGKLQLQKAPRDNKLQHEVGKSSGVKDDEGGHYIGARFNGPAEMYNLFPQNKNLNRTQWKKMENKWEKFLKDGYQIAVDIKPVRINDDDVRPFGVDVYYTLHKGGRSECRSRVFLNEALGEDLRWRERYGE